MKRRKAMFAGFILTLPLWISAASHSTASHQEELNLEDVLSKIEARAAPIETLTADIEFRVGGRYFAREARFTGRFEFVRGKSFRRQIGVAGENEFLLAAETFWSPRLAGDKAVVWLSNGLSLYRAFKLDPAKPTFTEPGEIDRLLLHMGADCTLADIALSPRQVYSAYREIRANRLKEGEKNFTALVATRKLNRNRVLTLSWIFDAATYRLERLELEMAGRRATVRCEKYARVNQVEIPERMVMKSGRSGETAYAIEITISHFDSHPESISVKTPSWLEDPVVPLATPDSAGMLLEKLRKDPDNASLASSLANLTAPWRAEIEGKGVLDALQRGLKAKPDSPHSMTALYCILLSRNAASAEKVFRDAMEKKRVTPEIHMVRTASLMAERKFKEALEAADLSGSDAILPGFKTALRLTCRAALAADAKELTTLLERELLGMDIPSRLESLRLLEPSIRHRYGEGIVSIKPAEVLTQLSSSGKPELMLLAARALWQKERHKEAATILAHLAGDKDWLPHLRAEMEYCGWVGEDRECGPLIKILAEETSDPDFMILAADVYLMERNFEKTEFLVKGASSRFAERNRKAKSRDSAKGMGIGFFISFLQKLMDSERETLAKELLVSERKKAHACLKDKTNIELIRRILGDDKESAFEILMGAEFGMIAQLHLTPEDVLTLMRKRLSAEKPEEADFEVGAGFVSGEGLRPEAKLEEITAILERGVRAFPDSAEFRERLADCYVLGGAFAKAEPVYSEALKLIKKEREDSLSLDGRPDPEALSGPVGILAEESGRFYPRWSVIEKLAYACLKKDDREGAAKHVEQFLKDLPDATGIRNAAQAYKRLGLKDQLLALHKRVFLDQMRSFDWSSDEPLRTGFELARAYIEAGKFEEAHAALLIMMDVLEKDEFKTQAGPGGRKDEDELARDEVKKLQAEVARRFGAKDSIRLYCEGKFAPLSEDKTRHVKALVEQLDSDDLTTRDSAADKIHALVPEAAPLLRDLMKDQNAETSKRLETLLLEFANKFLRERFEKP